MVALSTNLVTLTTAGGPNGAVLAIWESLSTQGLELYRHISGWPKVRDKTKAQAAQAGIAEPYSGSVTWR